MTPPLPARRRPDPRRAGRGARAGRRPEAGAVRRTGRWPARARVAMIFDKPTLRTQASFAAGIAELGGHPMLVDGALAGIGVRESVADVARVLGRQASAIVWRTYAQDGDRGDGRARRRPGRQRAHRRLPPLPAAGRPADRARAQRRAGRADRRVRRRRRLQHGQLVAARRRHRRHARPDQRARRLPARRGRWSERAAAIAAATGGSVGLDPRPARRRRRRRRRRHRHLGLDGQGGGGRRPGPRSSRRTP